MDVGLNGEIALVTEASEGLGMAIAHKVAAEGVRVAPQQLTVEWPRHEAVDCVIVGRCLSQ